MLFKPYFVNYSTAPRDWRAKLHFSTEDGYIIFIRKGVTNLPVYKTPFPLIRRHISFFCITATDITMIGIRVCPLRKNQVTDVYVGLEVRHKEFFYVL
jgi:hypothetical protein